MNKALLLLTTAVGCMAPSLALAQAGATTPLTGAGSATPADAQDGVADIVVTAERRATTAQKTPIAISTVSGDELRERQLNSIGQVLQQTPAVVIPNSSKGQAVFIRGIGSTGDAQEGGDPAVNLNIDGVYQQQAVVPLASTFDISRVEVLRGPQGTLYGRNSNAGSVNIVTNEATLGVNAGYFNLQVGDYDAVRAEAAGNVALGDKAALRVAFATNRHDGYYSNGGASADSYAARAKLRWEPTDRLTLSLTGLYAREEGAPDATVPAPLNQGDPYNTTYPAYNGQNGNPLFPPLAAAATPVPKGVRNVTVGQVYGQLDYDLGFGTLTVLPAWNYTHQYQDTALLPFGAAAQDVTENAESLETRIASSASSPIRWVAGLYFFQAEDIPVLDPMVVLNFPHNPRTYPTNWASRYYSRSLAAFGQVTVLITERLRLTGGARYTQDRKSVDFQTNIAPLVYQQGPQYRNDEGSVNLKGGIEYDLSSRSLFYAQVSNGYKAGGFNPNGSYYQPEKIVAYEGGVKNRFFGNRVQFNIGGFYYDYSGYQARVNIPDPTDTVTGASQQIINAAALQTYGGEAELTVQPTPRDRFYASVAYLHSRGHFVYTGGTYTAPQLIDIDDVTPPNSPAWSGLVSYSHRFDIADGSSISPRVDMRYSSGYDTSIDVSAFDYQPGFTRTDASITYALPNDSISIRVFIRNIENKVQKTFTLAPPVPFAALQLSDPQTYGVALSARF